jgi:hypothetical protein
METDQILALSTIGITCLIGLCCLSTYIYHLVCYNRLNRTQNQSNIEYNELV